MHEPAANVIVTESDAFFAAPATCCFGPVSLGRYDLETGALSWLARDAWSGVTGLAVSATRVYVIGDFSLFSIPLVGGDLRDEGIACDSISVAGATVAALVSGEVYVRSGDQGEFALLPTASYVDAMAATRSTVYVARDHGSAPGFTLEEHNLVYDQYEVLATGAGYARSLHVIDDSNSTYVVTESESSDDIFELYDLNALRAGTPLLQFPWDSQWTLTSTNSAVIGRAWIGTYHEGNRSGLRLVTFWDQPLILEWPTVGVVETLSATETDLWFVEPAGDAIVSVDVEAMVVGAIASIE